jgi:hypothetical protein
MKSMSTSQRRPPQPAQGAQRLPLEGDHVAQASKNARRLAASACLLSLLAPGEALASRGFCGTEQADITFVSGTVE